MYIHKYLSIYLFIYLSISISITYIYIYIYIYYIYIYCYISLYIVIEGKNNIFLKIFRLLTLSIHVNIIVHITRMISK